MECEISKPVAGMRAVVVGGITIDTYLGDYGLAGACPNVIEPIALALGHKHEFNKLSRGVGGGGANVATSLARLGYNVSICARVGSDLEGKMVLSELREEGVDTSLMQTDPVLKTGVAYIASVTDTHPLILAHRGANRELELGGRLPSEILFPVDILYLSGLSGVSVEYLPEFAVTVRKSYASTFIAVNPGASQLSPTNLSHLLKALSSLDLIILNHDEACMLWDGLKQYIPLNEKQCLIKECATLPFEVCGVLPEFPVAQYLLSLGVRYVCITRDARGAALVSAQDSAFVPALNCAVVSPLGAGDAFGSTLASGLAKKLIPSRALRQASINAASVISVMNTREGLLSAQAIDDCELAQLLVHPDAE